MASPAPNVNPRLDCPVCGHEIGQVRRADNQWVGARHYQRRVRAGKNGPEVYRAKELCPQSMAPLELSNA